MAEQWSPSPVPPIPPQILQAASEANLVVFVGAGVSRLMGCPSWDQLAGSCLLELAKRKLITFGEVDQLAGLDPRKRLTIALQIAAAEGQPLDLQRLVEPGRPTDSQVYEYLKAIGCAYVTTNYDRFLDRDPVKAASTSVSNTQADSAENPPELVCRPDQFTIRRLREPGTVVHLHGSVDDPESMIVTTPHYLGHYEDLHVQQFLQELFDRYTVLFVGYGLEEWEILEHIFRKGNSPSERQASRYMLSGFFAHQERTFRHLQRYYLETFGVRLLPFSRDHRDQRQLESVLEDWSGRLQVGTPVLADDLAYVLEVANE